jgi:hypothetical protein
MGIRKKVLTALVIAVIVGTLLNTINSYDVILSTEPLTTIQIIKISLTYITPFCVSIVSSLIATRAIHSKR